MSEVHIHLHLPPELTAALADRHLLHEILRNTERLITMGETNQATVDAANAAMQASLDAIQADIAAITTELQGAIPSPGAVPTQASLDTLNANVARLQAVKTALDALVVPPTVTHTPEDTTDTTANGSARADGSIRNNFFLPNFNPANPETT